MNFLADVFNQPANPEQPDVYLGPEVLVKNYFDWPPEKFRGWTWMSVVEPNVPGANLAFRPEVGRELLELEAVHIGLCVEKNSTVGVRFKTLDCLVPVAGEERLVSVLDGTAKGPFVDPASWTPENDPTIPG
jgi:hypothetical protein